MNNLEIEKEMLSQVDVEGLEKLILHLSNLNEDLRIDIREHLNNWAKNKSHLYLAFGKKLKLEKEIELDFSGNSTYVKSLISKFYQEITQAKVKRFLKSCSNAEVVMNCLNRNVSFENVKFRAGDKISKCIGKILDLYDITPAEKDSVLIKFSMLIQGVKAKGSAVLSIDPVDYITMSENNSNWESCHSMSGCFRTGPFAYLQDSSTTISYVKPKDDCVFTYGDGKTLTYSNKNWRQIVLFSKELKYATQLRQYPYTSQANQSTVASIVMNILNAKSGLDYQIHSIDVYDMPRYFSTLHECTEEGEDLCYNDLTNEAFKTAYWISEIGVEPTEEVLKEYCRAGETAKTGHYVSCLCGCGDELYDSESLYRRFSHRHNDDYDNDYYDDEDYY